MGIMTAIVPLLLGAVIEVPAGGDVAGAIARARDGDVVRLGPGVHAASLGRPRASIRIEGAGSAATEVRAPEGEDGLVVDGPEIALAGVALRAGPARSALKVLGGRARVTDAVLDGGAVGAFVDGGALEGRELALRGRYGLLARGGDVALDGVSARGESAGVALLSGRLSLRRALVTGPATEAGVTVSGGEATLEAVVVRDPGPSGLAVTGTGKVTGVSLDVAGAREVEGGALGACVEVRRGTVVLSASALVRCGGAAVEASGGQVELRGVDATGGEAGGIVLVDGARAELVGNVVAGRGPGLVAASGAHATARMNRWRTDPVLWVDCGAGARVTVGPGERVAEPCRPGR